MDVFCEVGFLSGVVNFLSGDGEICGVGLVNYFDVVLIVFIGLWKVGLLINVEVVC